MIRMIKGITQISVFLIVFFIDDVFAGSTKVQKDESENVRYNNIEENFNHLNNNIEQSNNIIQEIFKNSERKSVEDITIFDVIDGERVSPKLKKNILQLIDQYQYDLDSYRSILANRYKQAELKIVKLQKGINDMSNFRDEMEQNLSLAKWMIISLSIGIICLTSIVIVMWRNIMNVNKNDIEVIFSLEKSKKDLKSLNDRIKKLEGLNNLDTEEQISDDNSTKQV